MTRTPKDSEDAWVLPSAIVSRADMAYLVRDIEQYDQALSAYGTKKHTGVSAKKTTKPTPSDMVKQFLDENELSFTDARRRRKILSALTAAKAAMPIFHMTFATEPSREQLVKLVSWVRKELHSQAVIESSVQPALVAGVYIRTPNHVYDFSLRGALRNGREVLKSEIGALRGV